MIRTIRRTAYMIAQHLYWRFRRFEKARGYYLSENIRYIWRQRNAAKVMGLSSLPSLKDLKGKPFVFFPLATEPETALQQLSPEYLSQLSCIQAVCKYLPAGYTLVIKEHHTALGRRPSTCRRPRPRPSAAGTATRRRRPPLLLTLLSCLGLIHD